jgi:hypothetical protein
MCLLRQLHSRQYDKGSGMESIALKAFSSNIDSPDATTASKHVTYDI